MLTWFNPGPGTGYVFAICSGTVGALVMGAFGEGVVDVDRPPRTDTVTFSLMISGYLLSYLGITRLIVMPLSSRFGSTLAIPVASLAILMVLAGIMPTVLSVLFTGSPPYNYGPLEAIDWAWTLVEAFETRYSPVLALLILLTGIVITILNLMLLFGVFRYRRISVPQRVLEDLTES